MKTKYNVPEIKVLKLGVQDVIVTSTQVDKLGKQEVYDTSSGSNPGNWGDLWS